MLQKIAPKKNEVYNLKLFIFFKTDNLCVIQKYKNFRMNYFDSQGNCNKIRNFHKSFHE